jgi:hypothetical protein
VNHTQRIAHVARQRRSLTKAIVRDAVERYREALAEEIANGEWVDIPGIGKVQVSREEGKGFVTSITPGGHSPQDADAPANQNPPVREVQAAVQSVTLIPLAMISLSIDPVTVSAKWDC